MLIQEPNKWEFTSQIISENWIFGISIAVLFVSIVGLILKPIVLFVLLIAITAPIVLIQAAAVLKTKDRLTIHQGFYFLKYKFNKKAKLPVESIVLLDNCIQFKKKYFLGYEIDCPDYYSFGSNKQETMNLLYAQFVTQLPFETEIMIRPIRQLGIDDEVKKLLSKLDLVLPPLTSTKASNHKEFVENQRAKTRRFYSQKYYLIIKSSKVSKLIDTADYILETDHLKITQLNNKQLINVLCA